MLKYFLQIEPLAKLTFSPIKLKIKPFKPLFLLVFIFHRSQKNGIFQRFARTLFCKSLAD